VSVVNDAVRCVAFDLVGVEDPTTGDLYGRQVAASLELSNACVADSKATSDAGTVQESFGFCVSHDA